MLLHIHKELHIYFGLLNCDAALKLYVYLVDPGILPPITVPEYIMYEALCVFEKY